MAEQATVQSLPLTRTGAILKKRVGLWPALAAAVILIVIAGVFANHWMSDRYGVVGTASAYMEALSRGDAATAWSLSDVRPANSLDPVDASLIDRNALQAQLAVLGNRPPAGWTVSQGQNTGAVVMSNGATSTSLVLVLVLVSDGTRHFGIYPGSRVLVRPALLKITAPSTGPQVSIDGIAIPTKAHLVAVLPGRHVVTSNASSLFEATSTSVEARFVSVDKTTAVAVQPKLSAAGQQAAATAIKNALANCATSGWPLGDSCPRIKGIAFTAQPELIGDPTNQATYALDSSGRLVASGHLQTIVTIRDFYGAQYHRLAAGSYSAQLTGGDGSLNVAYFTDVTGSGIPFAKPSGVTDDTIVSAVTQALSACAAATSLMPADCPNQYQSMVGQQSNVHWSFQGSPTSGAIATFDPNTGAFQIAGAYSATARFHQTILISESDESRTVNGKYTATVVVDKNAPRLVTIQAAS